MLQDQYNYLSIIVILHIYIRINQSFISNQETLQVLHALRFILPSRCDTLKMKPQHRKQGNKEHVL